MAVSEFDLHAYVDGELTGEELKTVSKEILASEEYSDYVCRLHSYKQLLRLAYDTTPDLQTVQQTKQQPRGYKGYLLNCWGRPASDMGK